MNKIVFLLICLIVKSYGGYVNVPQNQQEYRQERDERPISMYVHANNLCTRRTGDPDYYLKFIESLDNSKFCVDSIFNQTALGIEIEELAPLGRINEIFIRTCERREEFFECFSDDEEIFNKCYTQEDKVQRSIITNTIRSVMRYLCSKDAQILTDFFEEAGPKCFEDKFGYIEKCNKLSLKKYSRKNIILPSTFVNEKTCYDISNYQKCLIPVLATCDTQIAANMLNEILNVILDELSCEVQNYH